MIIRFKQEAEVQVHPAKGEKRTGFKPGDEADLFSGVAERLVQAGVAERIPRFSEPADAAEDRASRPARRAR